MLEIGSGPRKVQDKYFQGLRAIPIARSTIAPTNPPWALLYVRTTPCAHESWHRGGVEVVVQHVRNFMGKQHVHDGHHLLTPTWIPSADLGFVSAWPPAPSQQLSPANLSRNSSSCSSLLPCSSFEESGNPQPPRQLHHPRALALWLPTSRLKHTDQPSCDATALLEVQRSRRKVVLSWKTLCVVETANKLELQPKSCDETVTRMKKNGCGMLCKTLAFDTLSQHNALTRCHNTVGTLHCSRYVLW